MGSTQKMIWPSQCIYTKRNLGLCRSDFSITTASKGFEQQGETLALLLAMVLFFKIQRPEEKSREIFPAGLWGLFGMRRKEIYKETIVVREEYMEDDG